MFVEFSDHIQGAEVRHRRHVVLDHVLLVLLLVLLVLALVVPPASAEAVAKGARLAGDGSHTRFTADITRPVSYSVYVLPDPYRVILDLPDVSFSLPPGSGQKAKGLISEYRYGELGAGRSRIVLDARGPVLIEKSYLVPAKKGAAPQLVVDIIPTTEEAFRASYARDNGAPPGTDLAALASATAQPAAAPPEPPAALAAPPVPQPGRRVIVIDPGHGGIDPGASSVGKIREKDVVLAVGHELRAALEATGRFEVVMTRSADKFLPLKSRVQIARDHKADLFISIHADMVRGQSVRGATLYTLSDTASDAEAEALAQKENRADIIAGLNFENENPEITGILIDLAQRESKNHAVAFSKRLATEIGPVTEMTGKPLRSAGFVVLKAPDVPSVLMELGFLSDATDAARLASPEWRQRIAKAMARAIDAHFAPTLSAARP
jgi:N-acetylmuramoyl-L-alanine amidase